MINPRVAVIGSGMAGLGAAYRFRQLGLECALYDRRLSPGGHTSSWTEPEGFTFDEGPHISFTENDMVKQVFAECCEGDVEEKIASVDNYWKEHWIKHPAICNLHGLPVELVTRILADLSDPTHASDEKPDNYEQWLRKMYGNTFAETFPMEYTKKYHTTEASNMSTDWLGPRLYRPKPQEVFRGALTSDTEDVHYVTTFRYPKRGGFVSFLSGLIAGSRIEADHCVEQIDVAERTIEFANGVMVEYDHLISSMPLPELVPRLKDVDPKVRDAAARLSCSSCVVVNLGIDRKDVSDNHWTYFYDEDFCFARLSFPHMFAASNAPSGCGSIQAEVYFSAKYRPFDGDLGAVKQKVLADLRRCGLVREDDNVMLCTAKYLPYANVIFDLDRKESLGIVHDYLDEHDVHYCGRYGDWEYIWTDQSFISGMKAADSVSSAL